MPVKVRQLIEWRIARRFILDALADGYTIAVNNGEEETEPFDKLASVLNAMFATDEEHLFVYRNGKLIGWVFLVYGNNGCDVISDYTAKLEHLLEGAMKVADKYSN